MRHKLSEEKTLAHEIAAHCYEVSGATTDFDMLLDHIGVAQVVLLGEASHGTHEFYKARADITRRLITERGFTAVAVEADWPDAYRVNRSVRESSGGDPLDALADFKRFPTWMWRNADVVEFVGWLAEHNRRLAPDRRAGFYGLDLYSLHTSMDAVIKYLQKIDPQAADRARHRYHCFDRFGRDPQQYGYAAAMQLGKTCEDQVVAQLMELRAKAADYLHRDGAAAQQEQFFAEQNARLALNAEKYYRSMFASQIESWNLRDQHMAETLEALVQHLGRIAESSRVVVWAHNSHLGDARATEMGQAGELNLGQLAREHWADRCYAVGFSTYHGTVSATSEWDGPVERKIVRDALPDSYEEIFHLTDHAAFIQFLRPEDSPPPGLSEPRLQRAIGVIYRPQTERASHYFRATLPDQFDAMIHFDHTSAVEPLERTAQWHTGESETFPSGL